MIIGQFTYDPATDSYRGRIETITEYCVAEFLPAKERIDGGADYHIVFESPWQGKEAGAAWKRKDKNGREFLSIIIDDPFFIRPLRAVLIPVEDGPDAILVWSRPRQKKPS